MFCNVVRGLVYALSLGDTFDLGISGCIGGEEWCGANGDASSSSSRYATLLVKLGCDLLSSKRFSKTSVHY